MRLKHLRPAVVTLALLGAACDRGLTDTNRNVNSPEVVPVATVLASGIKDLSGDGYGYTGEWLMLYHSENWVQHLAQPVYNDEDRYTPRSGVPAAVWNRFYAGVLQDFRTVKDMALEVNNQDLWAVGEILTVFSFLTVTDLYGDVPYSEALSLDKDIQAPKYDSQAQIYPDLLRRAREASAKITGSKLSAQAAQGDLLYGGDLAKWKEFGNSLQLRIAMRMSGSNARPTDKLNDARQGFAAAWSSDIFDANNDNATLVWEGTQPSVHPLYQQIVLGSRSGDFRLSSSLMNVMVGLNDPRLDVYAVPAASDGTFRGLQNGRLPSQVTVNGKPSTASDYATIGSYFLKADAPSVLMTYSEVLFLGAEAAARGWIGGNAETLYRAAIAASMQQYGISQAKIDAYLAQPGIALSGTVEQRLEKILTQKWISLYLAGTEAFSEFRRTGYPRLTPAAGSPLAAGQFPARLPYPPEEALYNPKNYPKDVLLENPVWWASMNR